MHMCTVHYTLYSVQGSLVSSVDMYLRSVYFFCWCLVSPWKLVFVLKQNRFINKTFTGLGTFSLIETIAGETHTSRLCLDTATSRKNFTSWSFIVVTAEMVSAKGSVQHFKDEVIQPGILDSFLMVTISMSVDLVWSYKRDLTTGSLF